MFEVGWSELLVIAIVLIVVVGPKDLPKMLRAFGKATTKFRATAGEFRRQFDEALKEAELDDVRDIINDAKSLDPRNDIRKVFDPVRTIGEEIRSNLKDATSAAKDNVAVPDPSA
ncbi:MAG: Sec-independent protein translocase protein TatB, partial [Phyllobacterium sp.]